MLRFGSITLMNFGPYKGQQIIDFPNHDGVVIFWGDNGRGKTTLLNAFRFALFGTIQRRNGALNSLLGMENKEAREAGEYGFSVRLDMTNNADAYSLIREYKPLTSSHSPRNEEDYAKRYFLKKNGAMLSPEDAEHELSALLPEHVSRFFLFDGELLQEYEELLIDDTSTGERIKNAIERILGVPILTNSRQDIDDLHTTLSKQKTKAVQNDSQTRSFYNTMQQLDTGIEEHKITIRDLERDKSLLYQEQVRIEAEMRKTEQLREWQLELDSVRRDLNRSKQTYNEQIIEMRAAMRDAWQGMLRARIDECLLDYKARVDVLEVKKNQKTIADKVIHDLRKAIDEHCCPICEQTVDGSVWDALNKRLQESAAGVGLAPEEKSELDETIAKIKTLNSMMRDSSRSRIRAIENQITALLIQIRECEQREKELTQRIAEYDGDADLVRDLPIQQQRLYQKLANISSAISEETQKLKDFASQRDKLEQQIKKLGVGSDLSEATRKAELCQKLYALFDAGVGKYRDALRTQVERDATELFTKITGDPDYVALKINKNYGLAIVHKSGQLVPGRSSGYEHVVALSLIGALHKNAPLRGPVIMDSLFLRLDKTHKKNLAKALPSMASQVIFLAYNGEIERSVAINQLSEHLLREYSLKRISSMYTMIEQGM